MLEKLIAFALIAIVLCSCERSQPLDANITQVTTETSTYATNNSDIEQAFTNKKSNVLVSGGGVVIKLLADDNIGAKHQKFLVKINTRQTLLFAHNIDLAPRVPLQINDKITFEGEYVYNPKGGIVHWTHHDPDGQHPAGWIMLNEQKYQ